MLILSGIDSAFALETSGCDCVHPLVSLRTATRHETVIFSGPPRKPNQDQIGVKRQFRSSNELQTGSPTANNAPITTRWVRCFITLIYFGD